MTKKDEPIAESERWGIPLQEFEKSAERLNDFLEKYHESFQTKTHDKSEYAYGYVSGLLRIETERNMANIARKTGLEIQNRQQSEGTVRNHISAILEKLGVSDRTQAAVAAIQHGLGG